MTTVLVVVVFVAAYVLLVVLTAVASALLALLGAGALLAVSDLDISDVVADVEWPTLVFFMGLFVMVAALVEVGVVGPLATRATEAVDGHYFLASSVLLGASGVLSGIVDNIPYVATMAPLVGDLVQAGNGAPGADAAWWSLALGADLDGDATGRGVPAQRRRDGHRSYQRSSDQLLDLHQVRARGRSRHHRRLMGYVALQDSVLA
jgi:Na+/H+ antiporter NhaD/arsenite permease-like protein